jgi:hypothetical protein
MDSFALSPEGPLRDPKSDGYSGQARTPGRRSKGIRCSRSRILKNAMGPDWPSMM